MSFADDETRACADILHEVRRTLGTPDGAQVTRHAQLIIGELANLRAFKRAVDEAIGMWQRNI